MSLEVVSSKPTLSTWSDAEVSSLAPRERDGWQDLHMLKINHLMAVQGLLCDMVSSMQNLWLSRQYWSRVNHIRLEPSIFYFCLCVNHTVLWVQGGVGSGVGHVRAGQGGAAGLGGAGQRSAGQGKAGQGKAC